jgi:antitoxin (DNA-binding transcriptional repressor) of toxin-antitoxin stability system
MKRYTVSVVRERLSEALDEAEKGVPVFIERKGVRFRLSVEKPKGVRAASRARIDILDPVVSDRRVDLGLDAEGADVPRQAPPVIPLIPMR